MALLFYPQRYLPTAIQYKGVWNASTNTPTLSDATGEVGDLYRVSVAGTQNLGSGSISFSLGDSLLHNGTIWEKMDSTADLITKSVSTSGDGGSYTVLAVDGVILVDADTGDFTVDLTGVEIEGYFVHIKKINAANNMIISAGTSTIEIDDHSVSEGEEGVSLQLVFHSGNWNII